MYDVYLAGVTTPEWRHSFNSQISQDISVFNPFLSNFNKLESDDKTEQIAREFYFMDQCDIIVFYFDQTTSKSARVHLGDAVGRGRQVVVCLDGKVPGKIFLKRYCEYRGVLCVETLDELITTVEQCAAELELCKSPEDEE